MDVTLTKWGNSIGIRLPMFVTKMLNLHSGDKVHVHLSENKVTIEPIETSNRTIIKHALATFDAGLIENIAVDELETEVWHG